VKDFARLVDLASERLGGRVLFANDEFFGPKENLLKAAPPVFAEGKYTSSGKWMDGWETRRRRSPGYDWCIIRLGLPGTVRGVVVDTSHFRGNFPEQCSIEACALEGNQGPSQERRLLKNGATRWIVLLPQSALQGDSQNIFVVTNPQRFTHLRFKIYPDGGVARLRVHGEVVPDRKRRPAQRGEIDLAAIESGGRVICSSDEFFGSPLNLLMPGRGKNMSDGWETRRRRGPGHDWVIVKLGVPGTIRRIEVDTAHFKGNYPESCSLEGADMANSEPDAVPESPSWREILPRTKLNANARHVFQKELASAGKVSHVRFHIYPDGGVSRLRLLGAPAVAPESRLVWLNSLASARAQSAFLDCCGSNAWVRQMVAARPFASVQQALERADRIWGGLEREDWLEAFRHHPPIGANKAAQKQSPKAKQWSAKEQSSVQKASPETKAVLAPANAAYQARFGHIFIVCAAGKTTEEILALLKQRLGNEPQTELRIAAEEQRKITRSRLEKLFAS
jgi:allantoicase